MDTSGRAGKEDSGPSLWVSIDHCRTERPARLVEVGWRLHNQGPDQLELEESWLPHGQFRAARQAFEPPLALPARQTLLHLRRVEVAAGTGDVIENAFLILRVRWQDAAWRVFARMRADVDKDGVVTPIVELVTTSPVAAAS